ncbi:MAG: NAD(P)-dependent oxidoreductase, partial [Candidatus Omnitrophica bacterium]|nr:NAD(P)-dependent oxidoreductase [Candidatus Omnitrophota bacterium]
MEKVLITGGSGFFGAHLAERLLRDDYSVRVLDRNEIDQDSLRKSVNFIKGDVRDRDTVTRACKDIDYVFHNAAILPVSRSSKREYWDVNVNGTQNVLRASLLNHIKKVIFISSSAPYGIPRIIPIKETTEFNPICDYGRSKAEAERACKDYRGRGLNVIILRPRTIIGTGRLGIFQILYSWIADNKNIYTIGSGENLMQFLSDKDFVEACILSIGRACVNEDLNLGAEKFGTVKEALQELIKYAKSSSQIKALPGKAAESVLFILDKLNLSPFTPWHYKTSDKPFYFDISKAKKILDWNPK